ncbi:hypothetical protein GOV09_02525 [Candidatus Woesearchaeota archaeon]|nr:hypothetical protein [Candidatus Woesearchaeota archaeon]
MNKKSQMELMGLAIVVVLLSLVFLFVVRFVILRPPSEPIGKEFAESEMAANFLNAMMETNNPDCSDIKMSTLFQDCANNPPDGRIRCSNPDAYSCFYLRNKLGELFGSTFNSWNINYNFYASFDPNDIEGTSKDILTFDDDDCTGNRRMKQQPLPLNPPNTLYLSLFICEGD